MGPILAFVLSVFAASQGDDLAGLPRSLQQQQPPKQDVPLPPMDPLPPSPGAGPTLHVGAVGRGLFPVTSMDRDLGLVPPGAAFPFGDLRGTFGWSDFFKVGVGGSLEFDLLWEDPAIPDAWVMGVYGTIGVDSFLGQKATDDRGASIDPENLQVFSLLVGPKVVKHFGGGFFVDGRLGMGMVHYSGVDADVHIFSVFPPSSMDYRGEFLASTATFGMELGFRGGLRSGSMSFVVGAACRVLAGAERGDNVQLSPNTLLAVGLDLGIELGF
jgi:hypothetical protein